MSAATPEEVIEITRACWDAATAAAAEDDATVNRCLEALMVRGPTGLAMCLASTGWAAIVADHVVGTGPGGRFSAGIENPDEATEIFAAIVCAVGNRDIEGAIDLLRDSEPTDAYGAALQLLGAAGAALVQDPGAAPRRP